MKPVIVDGSMGEGGGQVLRTALSLALATGRSFRIDNVRARREKPGLLRQHLAAVAAAQRIGRARVTGDAPGSTTVEFEPTTLAGGDHRIAIGTAGSTTLVLQAVLPALLVARDVSRLEIEGGTHNPMAPPFEFFDAVLRPALERMGPRISARLERHGFHPAGGGRIVVEIEPVESLRPIELLTRGPERARRAFAHVANLPGEIAERERDVLMDALGLESDAVAVRVLDDAAGPGNVVMARVEFDAGAEVFSAVGRHGVPAERVARLVARQTNEFLAADVPVGENLADQLLVPMALAGRGAFRTTAPSSHTRTVAEVLPMFLPVCADLSQESEHTWRVEVRPTSPPKEGVKR